MLNLNPNERELHELEVNPWSHSDIELVFFEMLENLIGRNIRNLRNVDLADKTPDDLDKLTGRKP